VFRFAQDETASALEEVAKAVQKLEAGNENNVVKLN